MIVGICLGIILALFNVIILKKQSTVKLEYIFCVMALILGLLYSLLLPPFSVPDEMTHFWSEYRWANEIMGQKVELQCEDAFGVKGIKFANMSIRNIDDAIAEYPSAYSKELYKYNYLKNGIFEKNTGYIDKEVLVATYAPIPAYLVGTLAIVIGRILSFSPFALIVAVRLANLLSYIFLSYFAIKLTPIGNKMMFVIALSPLAMQQAMSCAYDSLMNAVVFFYFAYILYLIYKKEKLERKDKFVLLVLCIFIALMKGVLIGLVFLIFLIPEYKFTSKKKARRLIGTIIVVSLIVWLTYNLASVSILDIISPDVAHRDVEYTGKEGVYFYTILQNPIKYLYLFVKTILLRGLYLMPSMTQTIVSVGGGVEYIFFGLFIVTAVCSSSDEVQLRNKDRLGIGLCYMITYGLLSVLTLIAFRSADVTEISLKGAYLISVFPTLGIVFKCKSIIINTDISKLLMLIITLSYGANFLWVYMI